MGAHRRLLALAVALGTGSMSAGALAVISATPRQSDQIQNEGTSSSQKKKSARPARRATVEEEVAPPAELTKAEELIQGKKLAEARPLLQKVVADDPSNYVAWFDLGFVENGLGDTEESIAAYRKSVAAKPEVFESNLNLGLQLAKSNSPDAEQFLRAATQLKPTSHPAEGLARAWMSLGHVIQTAKPEEAIVAYQHAATLQPKDPEPHLAAGLLREQQNRFADAEHEYQQALVRDPASSDAITGLANIYMRGRRFPEAEAELRKLVAAHPDLSAAHIQLGRVLAAQNKNEDAITQLEAAEKLAPADEALQRDLADIYYSAGKNEEAEKAYRALVTRHANDADLHHSLGQSLLRQKKYPEAQQEFLTCLKLKPDLAAAYGDLAFVAGENKNYALALKALDARAKLLPEIPVTYFLRASAYDHLQKVKEAVANYRLFLQAANGKYPDQEWQAKHRLIALEPKK
jgi:tetratricopeptide (TPR) repeat protein